MLALMTTAATLTSCGKNIATEAVAMEVTEETGLIVDDLPVELETPVTEKTVETEEPIYLDYEDLYLADNYLKVCKEKLAAVDEDSIEKTYEEYVLSESVDLYNFEGTWVGYSKPDIKVTLFGINENWAEVSFIRTILYIPRENFDAVASAVEEPETEILLAEVEEPAFEKETTTVQETPKTEKPKTETTKPATSKPVAEPSSTEPVTVEPEPVTDNTKYTPEEAIAVYRSIMEANGISWNPSLKNGGSWGTGWFYLKKGWIDENAYSDVEVFKMGGGDSTRPWDCYYIEITGSDTNAVYFTEWHP